MHITPLEKYIYCFFPVNQYQFFKSLFFEEKRIFSITFIYANSRKINEWKRIQNYFQGSKKYREEAFKSQSLSSFAAYWSQAEGKNVEHIPDFLLDCCFSAKRKISKMLCKILNIMSQIYFRGSGGKTANRKCFSIGVMI